MLYKTLQEAIEATAKRIHGTFIKSWEWPGGLATARFQLPNDKTFRCYHRADGDAGGWLDGDPPGLLPLYRGDDLTRFPDETVYLVEGEGKADVLADVGLLGIASAHGAQSAARTDWTALAGRKLVILPDNDTAGRTYAETVAGIVTGLQPPTKIKVVALPGLRIKEDVVNWVALGGPMGDKTTEEIKTAIVELAAKAPPWTPHTEDDERVPTTDLGNAQRFARRAAGQARYCGQWGRWIVWKLNRWKMDESLDVLTLAKCTALGIFDEAKAATDPTRQDLLAKWAVKSQSRDRLTAMVDLARPDLAVNVDALDADPFALNVLNGVLDLRTGQLRRHDPRDLFTRLAPVRFHPTAMCPLWDRFIDRIMDHNTALIIYLQRLGGMCLTADISEQGLWLPYGGGANGKTVLTDTWTGILGDYAGEAPPDLLLMRSNPEHPTEIADLCGRRLVVASETDEGRRLRVQLVKRLTGNSRLKARYMRGDYFEFARTHKLILATNNKPIIKETTLAIWRRIKLVPFNVTIPLEEQDRHLADKLRAEWPGVLNWLLRGCLAWQRDGLDTPTEVVAATDTYQAEQDPLAEFFDSCCTFATGVCVPRADLFGRYANWAEQSKEHHPLDRTSFFERVRRRPGVEEARRRVDGRVTRLFSGIGLASAELFNHET
jgi:putative DNA primase/helicase